MRPKRWAWSMKWWNRTSFCNEQRNWHAWWPPIVPQPFQEPSVFSVSCEVLASGRRWIWLYTRTLWLAKVTTCERDFPLSSRKEIPSGQLDPEMSEADAKLSPHSGHPTFCSRSVIALRGAHTNTIQPL